MRDIPIPQRTPRRRQANRCCHWCCHSWQRNAGRVRTSQDRIHGLTCGNGTKPDNAGPPRMCLEGLKNPWASAREGSSPSPGTHLPARRIRLGEDRRRPRLGCSGERHRRSRAAPSSRCSRRSGLRVVMSTVEPHGWSGEGGTPTTCASCGQEFLCWANASSCWCDEVSLTDEQRKVLAEKGSTGCLCRSCLEGLET